MYNNTYIIQYIHILSTVCILCTVICYLLQIKLPLNLLEVTGVVGDWFRQFSLNVSQPGAQAAHILIQLLHSHQCLSQLLYSINTDKLILFIEQIVNKQAKCFTEKNYNNIIYETLCAPYHRSLHLQYLSKTGVCLLTWLQ